MVLHFDPKEGGSKHVQNVSNFYHFENTAVFLWNVSNVYHFDTVLYFYPEMGGNKLLWKNCYFHHFNMVQYLTLRNKDGKSLQNSSNFLFYMVLY
jgi:hypothetical protein